MDSTKNSSPSYDVVRQRLAALTPNPKRQSREAMARFKSDILAAFKAGAMPSDVSDLMKELGYELSKSVLNRLYKESKQP